MSPSAVAFAVGLTVLFGALFSVVFAWWREASALDQLMLPGLRGAAAGKLHGAIGEAATGLDRALGTRKSVDDSLSQAIATVSKAQLAPRWASGVIIDALIALSAIAPLGAALLVAAEQVASLPDTLGGAGSPSAYVSAVRAIPAAFSGLGEGVVLTVVLLFVAALVAVCRYALLRPEAREARAIRAFVHATALAAPDATAPQSGRLLALLAPSTSLKPALLASLAFVLLSAAAVLTLAGAAGLKQSNAAPLSYASWPRLHIESGEVLPPALPAGRPLGNGPSLIVSRERVQLGAQTMTGLEDGQLIAGWQAQALAPAVASGARPLLVASPNASLSTLIGVMRFLREKGASPEFQWVVDRKLPGAGIGEVQASIPVALAASPVDAGAVAIEIDASSVRFAGASVGLTQLREQIAGRRLDTVPVRTRGALSYGRVIEVLAAVDGVCEPPTEDCGLPGRGLSFVLDHADSPE